MITFQAQMKLSDLDSALSAESRHTTHKHPHILTTAMRTFVLVASLFSCTNAWFGIAPEPGLTPGAAGKITMFSMNDDGEQRNSLILVVHTVDKQVTSNATLA